MSCTLLLFAIILVLFGVLLYMLLNLNTKKGFIVTKDHLVLCKAGNRVYFAQDDSTNRLRRLRVHYFKLEANQNMFYSKLRINDATYLYYDDQLNDCYLTTDLKLATIFKLIIDDNKVDSIDKVDLFYDDTFVKIKNYLDDSLVTAKDIKLTE